MGKPATCFKCDKEGLRWVLNRKRDEWEMHDIHGFKHVCSPCDLFEKNEREAPIRAERAKWRHERNRRRLIGVSLTNRLLENGLLDDLGIK